MDPNQYNWKVYYNFLQNYQLPHSNIISQNPTSFFSYLSPPPPMNYMQNNQTPSTENSQTFSSMPQNSSSMFHNPPISNIRIKTHFSWSQI